MSRRFQINPEPLRTRGAIPQPDYDADRCEAIAKNGLRCQWECKVEVGGRKLCGVHARAATRLPRNEEQS